jgi:hypothetical protein
MIKYVLTPSFEKFNNEDLKLNKYVNVTYYKYGFCYPELVVNINENALSSNREIFYIFECTGYDAFAHFFFESFIFYKNIIELTKIYPNIKILTNNKKKYVKSLFKLFNINNEIIYHNTDYSSEKYISNDNNICFFPKLISLCDYNIDVVYFTKLINEIIEEINNKIPQLLTSNNILLLPRNSVDNFTANDRINDRIIYGIEEIKSNIIELGGIVLDTYSLNNMYHQFMIIKNSNIIICDFGSSYFINAIFLKNKKIIVLDNYNLYKLQTSNSSPASVINSIIMQNNNVIIIEPQNINTHHIGFYDIINYIDI